MPAFGACLCARMGAVVCRGGGGGRCAARSVGVVGCGCACGPVLGVGSGGSAGGGRVVAVCVAAYVVWWCVAGVCSAWMVPVWVFGVGCWMWVRPLRGVVGRDGGFSDVCGRLVAGVVGRCGLGGGGSFGWTAWWMWCRWAALMMGLGFVVAGGRVWWWWQDGVSLRVLLGVVPLDVWFVITEHSPLRAAQPQWSGSPSGRQCVPARCSRVPMDGGCSVCGRGWVHCRAHTRPSRRRLFRSRQGSGSLPGAHTSVQTADVS